jgi:mannose-1-phosphate guanylyltransferase/mannose-6-phosphate isomerase
VSVYPVIMCGGSGTRLWPASRPESPKQFLPLAGEGSSFQQTVRRVVGVRGARELIVVAGARHGQVIADQLRALGVEASLLLEPEARDSAPAIAAAAAWIAGRDPDGVAVVVSSDHYIPDEAAFQAAASRAVIVAEDGWIVTLGVGPTTPSTAFGYIKPSARALAGGVANAVEAFVEKPDRATAERYIAEGYLWNSGNFVGAAATLLAELDAHAPAVAAAARAAVQGGAAGANGAFFLGPAFATAPKVSIDYAVMEKTRRAAVAPAAFAWSDLGAWDAVKAASAADACGNSVTGPATLVEVTGSLVRNTSALRVGLVGVEDIAVVVEADAVLVTRLAAAQGVKQLVDRMGAAPAPPPSAPPAGLTAMAERLTLWLDASALPLWWSLGADHARGGFHERLDQGGRPTDAPRRGRVQARQIFVYASAGGAGWPGPWRAAADHGWRYLKDRFQRDDGLFRTLVGPDGAMLDDGATLYDQAFVLLALAALHGLDPDRCEWLEAASDLVGRVRARFGHGGGGFAEAAEQPFQSNPLMHLFEAALAWSDAGGGALWEALAGEIAVLALDRLIDPTTGAIDELYTADWTPRAVGAGRIVWPGHQFEWAWLLDRWARRSGDPRARAAALRLFEVGSAGVDRSSSLCLDAMDQAFWVTDPRARLWPQTERLKAALSLSAGPPPARREALLGEAADAARALWRYLQTPVPGLWRDRALSGGGFVDEAAPASSLYHIIGAVHALDRLASALGPRPGDKPGRVLGA